MTRVTVLLTIPLLLAGCATAEQRAAKDDATCKSYGAQPGTDAYVQCRMVQQARRDAKPDAGDAMMAAGRALQGIDNSQPAMAPMGNLRLQTTCVKQGIYTVCQ
jgi:hypothetical protein